jgi:hypothetical protein
MDNWFQRQEAFIAKHADAQYWGERLLIETYLGAGDAWPAMQYIFKDLLRRLPRGKQLWPRDPNRPQRPEPDENGECAAV